MVDKAADKLEVRPMTAADIPFGMRLKDGAGWNQTEADWARFLDLARGGAFVAAKGGVDVGTVVTFLFGHVGWIAMLLVDPDHRHQGIGTRLLSLAVDSLHRRGAETVRLDATPLGRPIYRQRGFLPEYDLHRFEGTVPGGEAGQVEPVRPADLERICRLDLDVSGTRRRPLLESLVGSERSWGCTVSEGDQLLGFALTRAGSRAMQVGPAAARDGTTGIRLLEASARRLAGGPVFLDIPEPNPAATRWAESQGLVRQRVLTRMFLGRPVSDRPDMLWASSGPEKG